MSLEKYRRRYYGTRGGISHEDHLKALSRVIGRPQAKQVLALPQGLSAFATFSPRPLGFHNTRAYVYYFCVDENFLINLDTLEVFSEIAQASVKHDQYANTAVSIPTPKYLVARWGSGDEFKIPELSSKVSPAILPRGSQSSAHLLMVGLCCSTIRYPLLDLTENL